jgi:hypothetical protein
LINVRKSCHSESQESESTDDTTDSDGCYVFREFEALVVALGGAELSASGVDVVLVVIATIDGVGTTGGVTTVGVGVGSVEGV